VRGIRKLKVEVLATYPHDTGAYTQGLVLHEGVLYESSGGYGRSEMRIVALETGEVSHRVPLPESAFAEGVTIVGDRLWQLTWKEGLAFRRDRATLAELDRVRYSGEGWGLCHEPEHGRLVMSNGSPELTLRDPDTFEPTGVLMVTREGTPVWNINELECVGGKVWANVWHADEILCIDLESGAVQAVVDAAGLVPDSERINANAVLNGIAAVPDTDTFLITGKRWPRVFQVRFVSAETPAFHWVQSKLRPPKPAARVPDLIFDIGMRHGEDAAFYLAKGFQVVAFEADPTLAEEGRQRFRQEIAAGRLRLIEGAIVPGSLGCAGGKVRFYSNDTHTEWGTIFEDWARRNETTGHPSEAREVDVVDLERCLEEFGIPYYMKIDIEGADVACLDALASFAARPDFVSIESEKVSFRRLTDELDILSRLGYEDFQVVQQGRVHRQRPPFPAAEGEYKPWSFSYGSSGLFGNELPGEWVSRDAAIRRYRLIFLCYRLIGDDSFFGRHRAGRRLLLRLSAFLERLGMPVAQPLPGWCDTHARHRAATRVRSSPGATNMCRADRGPGAQ
jgi:FkbM family methyltransferase